MTLSRSPQVPPWPAILSGWAVLGIAYSMAVTPSGRLLRRSSGDVDRPALFAAQFALSHACWLIAYPIAGEIGARAGMGSAFLVLAGLAAVGLAAALLLWPRHDPDVVPHRHDSLPPDHPHWREHASGGHPFVIDELHPTWPFRAA